LSEEIVKLAARLVQDSRQKSDVSLQPREIAIVLSTLRTRAAGADGGAPPARSEAYQIVMRDNENRAEVLAVVLDFAVAHAVFDDLRNQNPGRNLELAKAPRNVDVSGGSSRSPEGGA